MSMTLTELQEWAVVRRVWRPGERREFFEAETDLWKMISKVVAERERFWVRSVRERIEQSLRRFAELADRTNAGRFCGPKCCCLCAACRGCDRSVLASRRADFSGFGVLEKDTENSQFGTSLARRVIGIRKKNVDTESQVPKSSLASISDATSDVLSVLSTVSAKHKIESLAATLSQLRRFVGSDLAEVEAGLATIEHGDTPMHDSAKHLLGQKGKRLRPLCRAGGAGRKQVW